MLIGVLSSLWPYRFMSIVGAAGIYEISSISEVKGLGYN